VVSSIRRRGERGHLHVGLQSGAGGDLPHRVFTAFGERLPGADLDFHYFTWTDSSVGLRSGATDVAFVRPPIAGDLEYLPLFSEPRVAVCLPHTRSLMSPTSRSPISATRCGACCHQMIRSGATSGWPPSTVTASR
jgi:DNA-binding transcriptional LysR family regulator